jgi:hypothetical protein
MLLLKQYAQILSLGCVWLSPRNVLNVRRSIVMQCPNCKYEHGWNGDTVSEVKGAEGNFFKLSIKVERTEYYRDERSLFACPSCRTAFMGESWE